MRRRSKMKALKRLPNFIQGRIVVYWLLVLWSYVLCEPGYLDFDNLPETNFTCAGKVIGGYYADLETSCQMFHVCTIGQLDEPMDIKFLCLNGTVFDQETRVCERVDEVDCTKSERFYYLNLELYGNTMLPLSEDESSSESNSQSKAASESTTIPTTTVTVSVPKTAPTHSNNDDKLHKEHSNKLNKYPSSSHTLLDTPIIPIIFNLSTTPKPFEDDDELEDDEEYDYDDDFYTTNGKEQSLNTSPPSHKLHTVSTTARTTTTTKSTSSNHRNNYDQTLFSPQQFILNQNHAKEAAQSIIKLEPISFQQQKFQHGGTLTVTNSHVMPTSSTTTPSSQKFDDSGNIPNADLSYLQSFRAQGQGFRLPSVHLTNNYGQQQHILQQQQHELLQKQLKPSPPPPSFEGYRKQQKPQITLRLPIEDNRPRFGALDDIFASDDTKELKQSDSHAQSRRTAHITADKPFGYKTSPATATNKTTIRFNSKPQAFNVYTQSPPHADYSNPHFDQHNTDNIHSHSNYEANSNYDRVLLTPQDQYIPTLPKVIITASASVSDGSGKKLNYSVGNVLASNIKLPPIAYDEYREDDVSLDPFFLDVPKISPRREKRTIK